MNDALPLANDDDRRVFQQMLGLFDVPAFVQRARQVEEAWEQVLGRCRQQRDKWLEIPRIRLATLVALGGDWSVVAGFLRDRQDIGALQTLCDELQPRLRCPVAVTKSESRLRGAFKEYQESAERFNRRWERFLIGIDLSGVNQARENYNRYYVLEKECALGLPSVARRGFKPLAPLGIDDLRTALPLLPVPQMRES
jgi:hypothetical protein